MLPRPPGPGCWFWPCCGRARPGSAGSRPVPVGASGQRHLRLPLQMQRNLLVVQVWLNGAGPYNFLLDTGVVARRCSPTPAVADSLALAHGAGFPGDGRRRQAHRPAGLRDAPTCA
ncbi:MAG: hypothetical protein WKG07_15970 [Hymenobacter sp.]